MAAQAASDLGSGQAGIQQLAASDHAVLLAQQRGDMFHALRMGANTHARSSTLTACGKRGTPQLGVSTEQQPSALTSRGQPTRLAVKLTEAQQRLGPL